SIKSTLPKLVLANQSFYIRGNSNGSLIIYVPKSNTSTVNFNVTLNCSSSSNCYQTNISDENEIEIASSYVNNSGKKLVVNVVNKDDGSFYKLSFYNFIPVSYLYVQLSGTSPYTSPNKLYWMDIDAPILKLILQKNFESDVDMIYVYYSNNSAISVAKPTFNLQLTNYILVNDYFYWKFLANAFYIKPGVD
ncbi:MAG: hypothetical protein QXP04_05235, partial [Candidatus Nanoarchaeia archaeon]|nr:hypothetical protein [Candidatus Jingweiarchaeum tengchongense]